MQLYLKINGEFVPITISNDNDLALTYNYDGLESPVKYISEFTYEIKIPKTKENNILLEHVGSDSIVTDSWFDPSTKIEYRLLSKNSAIISSGNAYLNNVDDKYYYIQLLGSMNNVFTKLLNAGWDTDKINPTSESYNKDYYLMPEYLNWNGTDYSKTKPLNYYTVYGTWLVDSRNKIFNFKELKENYNDLCYQYDFSEISPVAISYYPTANDMAYVGNILQFAPTNQGLYPDFDSTRWYTKDGIKNRLVNVFRGLNNDIDGSPFPTTDKGVREVEVGEYRSYYQKPCIFVQRLFEWFRDECPKITGTYTINEDGTRTYNNDGYKLVLDKNWYNESNAYVNSLVYTLPSLYSSNNNKVPIESFSGGMKQDLPSWTNFDRDTNKVEGLPTKIATYSVPTDELYKEYNIKSIFKIGIYFADGGHTDSYKGIKFNSGDNGIVITQTASTMEDVVVFTKTTLCIPLRQDTAHGAETLEGVLSKSVLDLYKKTYDNVIGIPYHVYSNYGHEAKDWILSEEDIELTMRFTTQGIPLKYNISARFMHDYTPFINYGSASYGHKNGDFRTGTEDKCYLEIGNCMLKTMGMTTYRSCKESNRSNQTLTLNKLFKGINPFSVLLKFSKMLNMVWVVNDEEKIITLYDRYTHFGKCMSGYFYNKYGVEVKIPEYAGVLDLTNYVDISKGYELSVPSWKDKFIELNYSDKMEVDYVKDYKKKYNRTYGSKTVITQNNKNNDTYKLFCNNENDTINPSILSSEMVISEYSIVNNIIPFNITPYFPQILNEKDGKSANIWNNFYFRLKNGTYNKEFNRGYRAGYVYITDDLYEEINNDNYAWHGDTQVYSIKTVIRPRFGTEYLERGNFKSIHFAPVQEKYYVDEVSKPYTSVPLYDNYWKKYINQIYNIESKKLTLHIHIPATIYNRIKLNPLVQIKNTLYLVSSIEDWNEDAVTTKVNLVSIRNLEKLVPNAGYLNPDVWCWDNENILIVDTIAFDNGDTIITN